MFFHSLTHCTRKWCLLLALLALMTGSQARAEDVGIFEKVTTKYRRQLSSMSLTDAALDPWTGALSHSHIVELAGWGAPEELTRMVMGLAMRRRLDGGFDWTEAGVSLNRYLLMPISKTSAPQAVELPQGFTPFADDGQNRVVAGFVVSTTGEWWVWQYDRLTHRLLWVSENIGQFASDQARWHLAEIERRGTIRKGRPNQALSRKALVLALFMKTMDLPYPIPPSSTQLSRAGDMLANAPNRELSSLLVEFMDAYSGKRKINSTSSPP